MLKNDVENLKQQDFYSLLLFTNLSKESMKFSLDKFFSSMSSKQFFSLKNKAL